MTAPNDIRIVEADLDQTAHQDAVVFMTDHYAQNGFGSGKPLPDQTRQDLIAKLKQHPTTLIFLAFSGEPKGGPIGIATCFVGFSTFAAAPLVNVHDLAVHEGHRGRGIGKKLLAAVSEKAKTMGCCKVTLEVREDNAPAIGLYRKLGFGADDAPGQGHFFLAKSIS